MALSRFIILKNPNGWIIPSNLNTDLLNSTQNKCSLNNKISVNYLTSSKKTKKYSLSNYRSQYNNYKKLLISKNVTTEMKEFLNRNIDLSLKILNHSTTEEIKYIIKDPSLLIEPIKKYIKKSKSEIGKENGNLYFIRNYNFYNSNNNITNFDLRDSKQRSKRLFSLYTRLSNDTVNKQKAWIEKKSTSNKFGRRNKSTGDIVINQNIIDEMNQSNFLNDIKGTKDYNDSYEDYKLSIDSYYDN
jgi:hypothetical protein